MCNSPIGYCLLYAGTTELKIDHTPPSDPLQNVPGAIFFVRHPFKDNGSLLTKEVNCIVNCCSAVMNTICFYDE